MRFSKLALLACLVAGLGFILAREKAVEKEPLLHRVEPFTLRDFRGEARSLSEFGDKHYVVVVFLGIGCPLAKSCVPILNEMAEKYGPRDVAVLAIDSNHQDSSDTIADFVREAEASFPVLCDPDQAVADRFNATRTPEAFVLDAQGRIRYRGPVASGKTLAAVSDLRNALDDLLADRPVRKPEVAAVGCRIGRKPATTTKSALSYVHDIRPIIERRCGECHRPGEIAPFSLLDWKNVAAWSGTIREVVEDGRMPPWNADPRYGHFKNDARMTSEEKRTLLQWIADGCFQGDVAEAAPRAKFVEGWRIPQPDQIVGMADQPFQVPAKASLDYQYFLVDPGFKEDKFIQAAEVRPGSREVVHHALVSLVPPGGTEKMPDSLGAMLNFAPGMQPTQLAPGWAIRVPAGSKFLFQMHYTPNGKEHADRSCLGLVFADPHSVTHEVHGGAIANPGIDIPAGVAEHRESAEHVFRTKVRLLSLSPHMHLRGKSFRIEAELPNCQREILLEVPRYDFHWQLRYEFAEPRQLPAGSRLVCTATYDNSAENRNNPNPQERVTWGDQTWNEMLIGFISYAEEAD